MIYLGRRHQPRDFAEAAVRADSSEGLERAQNGRIDPKTNPPKMVRIVVEFIASSQRNCVRIPRRAVRGSKFGETTK